MPRFLTDRDVRFFRQINKELIDDVIETLVVVWKLSIVESPTNIYGEAVSKKYHIGTQIPALIRRENPSPTSDGNILDISQTVVFAFLRDTLQEKNIYPEMGDIIEYDNAYWEINNTSENQLLADQTYYNWSIVCSCHLTKRSALQLEPRQHEGVESN